MGFCFHSKVELYGPTEIEIHFVENNQFIFPFLQGTFVRDLIHIIYQIK